MDLQKRLDLSRTEIDAMADSGPRPFLAYVPRISAAHADRPQCRHRPQRFLTEGRHGQGRNGAIQVTLLQNTVCRSVASSKMAFSTRGALSWVR